MKYELVLGITTKCNGKCKLCARHIPSFNKGVNLAQELNLDMLKPYLDHFKSLIFVGGYGEAVLHSRFKHFLAYVNMNYPDMYLNTSSNMGVHNESYWADLAQYNIELTANIDGIGESNKIYRGQDYDKCIRNLKAFIDAGGRAKWSAIHFDFNKDQFEEMEQIARDLGCTGFCVRRSDDYIPGTELFCEDNKPRKFLCETYPGDNIYCEWEGKKIFLNEFGVFAPCCHSDKNYGSVREDEYLSEFYEYYNTGMGNDLEYILGILNGVYGDKERIPLCNKLCSVPERIKPMTVYLTNKNF